MFLKTFEWHKCIVDMLVVWIGQLQTSGNLNVFLRLNYNFQFFISTSRFTIELK